MSKAMTLEIFGVVFAAICVWLAVRIVRRKERWVKWTAGIGTAVLFAYPLSFGPMCWLVNQQWCPTWIISANIVIYFPILLLDLLGPQQIHDKIAWYTQLWR
jgi:hypothetical protein